MYLKKFILPLIVVLVIGCLSLFYFFKDEKNDLTKIRVAEVTHSIFYAPQYVAHALGYFKEEGLDVELLLVPGADKVTSAVLSGDVEIGFCGSEATIYIYNQGEKDYLVNFAALTKRDGSFLVSREKYDQFTLDNLKGKSVIGGRKGGMPEMTLEWALKQNGIDPKKDLEIDTSIAFASMAGSFIGGNGDFVTLFEPQALSLEQQGYGYVVASIGELGGIVPYTAYNAKKSYIENHEKEIKGFSKAIQKGLDYVKNHNDEEVAKTITSYFPDTSMNDLVKIIKRYRDNDSWFETTEITEKDYQHIEEIMKSAGELTENAPYDKLVTTKFVNGK